MNFKNKLFNIANKYISEPPRSKGCFSCNSESFKDDNLSFIYAYLGDCPSISGFRIKGSDKFNTFFYAFEEVGGGWKWTTNTKILITIEGIKIFQEIPKTFGDNILSYAGGTFRHLSKDHIKVDGDSLFLRTRGFCNIVSDVEIKMPISPKPFYNFLIAANQFVNENIDAYDDTIDEYASSDED